MTSRRLRGSQAAPDTSSNKAAVVPKEVPKEVPKKKEPSTPKETPKKKECAAAETPSKSTSVAATKKPVAATPASPDKPLPYGSYEDSGDYPLVPEVLLTNEQKRLLQALLTSTQCSRPLTVALPVEPCFVCPQLDQQDALAAAQALSPADGGTPQKTSAATGKLSTPSPATAVQKAAEAVRATSVSVSCVSCHTFSFFCKMLFCI